MKLLQLRTREPVTDDSGAPTAHFTEDHGHLLSLDQGIVTILGRKMEQGRLVPLSNVLWMVPAPKEAKK